MNEDTELEKALDIIEQLNQMWNWNNIHKNDEQDFKDVQEFLIKHNREGCECKF